MTPAGTCGSSRPNGSRTLWDGSELARAKAASGSKAMADSVLSLDLTSISGRPSGTGIVDEYWRWAHEDERETLWPSGVVILNTESLDVLIGSGLVAEPLDHRWALLSTTSSLLVSRG